MQRVYKYGCQRRFFVLLVGKACLTSLLLLALPLSATSRYPEFTKLAKIRVGVSTIADLEKHFGPGLMLTGAHSGSARLWQIKKTGWFVYADGFQYATGRNSISPIVEDLQVSIVNHYNKKRNIPVVRVNPREFYILGVVHAGMKLQDAKAALRILPPFEIESRGKTTWFIRTVTHPGEQTLKGKKVESRAYITFQNGVAVDVGVESS